MPANMRRAVQAGTTWPADANWKGAPGPEESRYLGSVSTTVHSTVIGQLAKPRGAKSVAKKPGGETKSGEVFGGGFRWGCAGSYATSLRNVAQSHCATKFGYV